MADDQFRPPHGGEPTPAAEPFELEVRPLVDPNLAGEIRAAIDAGAEPVSAAEARRKSAASASRPGLAGAGMRSAAAVFAGLSIVMGAVGFAIGRSTAESASPVAVGDIADAPSGDLGEDGGPGSGGILPQLFEDFGAAFRGGDSGGFSNQPLTEVVRRTTSSGAELRGYVQPLPREFGFDNPFGGEWSPPRECYPSSSLTVHAFDGNFVAEMWADDQAPGGHMDPRDVRVIGSDEFGYTIVSVSRVDDAVTRADLTLDGAVIDTAEPAAGWVVLAAPVPRPDIYVTDGTPVMDLKVLAFDGSGTVISGSHPAQARYPNLPQCVPPPPPPPSLPPGIDDLPPGETRAGIEAAFAAAFGEAGGEPGAARPYIEGGDDLPDDYFAELRDAAEGVGIGSIMVHFLGIGLESDDQAIVVFQLDGAPIGPQIGQAVRHDGQWKVARDTWCGLVAALVPCPGHGEPE